MMRRHRRDLLLLDIMLLLLLCSVLFFGNRRNPTGEVTSQVLVIENESAVCNMTLVQGWNLMSTYCEPDNNSIEEVLRDINGTYISVHAYDPFDGADPWKVYNPWLPNWTVKDLFNITRTKGYWINMNETDTLAHNGTWFSPTFVPLSEPVTLAGHPSNVTYEVNRSVQGIVSSVEAVYLYNATDSADPWKVYNPTIDPSLNDLKELVPFHGLWFRLNDNASWMVIWG